MATEPDKELPMPETSDDLSRGRPAALDPIGREIARMKIGDALFGQIDKPAIGRGTDNNATIDDAPSALARDLAATRRWRGLVLAVVAVAAALAIHQLW